MSISFTVSVAMLDGYHKNGVPQDSPIAWVLKARRSIAVGPYEDIWEFGLKNSPDVFRIRYQTTSAIIEKKVARVVTVHEWERC